MKTGKLKLGVLQFSPAFGDIQGNIKRIGKLLDKAPRANLWVLPELASTGYDFANRQEALALSEELSSSEYVRFLTERAASDKSWFVTGINEREGDRLYNSAVLIGPDGVHGVYRKLHLFRREKEFFEPGNMGLPIFETPFGKIGMLICFDWMFPEAWRLMSLKGVQMICHPSNLVLPFCQSALPGYALTNRVFIATANRIGSEGDLKFTGGSMVVDPTGKVLLAGKKKKKEALVRKINLAKAVNKQLTPENDIFADRRADVYNLSE